MDNGLTSRAPIVAHRISCSGGRRIMVQGRIMGLAHSDRHLWEFLRRAGLPDAENLLDDPAWVALPGDRAHEPLKTCQTGPAP
jgi:hypothetical protein